MNRNFFILGFAGLLIVGLAFALPSQANDKADRGPLEKITFIHYKKGYAKPPWAGGGGGNTNTVCYGFLSKGAKWKTSESYKINPTNSQGLSQELIVNSTNAADANWDNQVTFNIFGSGTADYNASYNNGNLDGNNTLSFGSISNTGAIAVTTVWGYFGGPIQTRELIEWDMLLDQVDFQWGDATIDSSKMDVQNIITHEIGHSAGMGDLYDSGCGEETMYGYSTEGETKKRDLNSGDITGIKKLYN
ncbi:MAG: matrixin family metalloprotease [archaeon]